MISGLAKAAITLQNEDLLHRAQRAVDFIKKHSVENGHLLRIAYVGVDGEIVKRWEDHLKLCVQFWLAILGSDENKFELFFCESYEG